MLNLIRKYHLALFYIVYACFAMCSNFVHPVTPAFLQMINCSSSMFGFAFAAMALGQFITSALWGRLGDRMGYARSMVYGYLGYGLSAIIFSLAKSWHLVVLGRFIGGLTVSATQVGSMAYLTSMRGATSEEKSKLLVMHASLTSIGGAFGFLIGGLIGDINLYYSFYSQAGVLLVLALTTFFFIREHEGFEKSSEKLTVRDVNPFTSIIDSSKLVNIAITVFLVSAFLSMFSSTGFDQNFNYFLRAKFNFAPSSSGLFKAVVGVVSLLMNMTVSMWIVRRMNISKGLAGSLAMSGLAIIAMVLAGSTTGVLAFALIYYAFYAIYLPLQQSVMLKNDDESSKGAVAGLYNTARSLGMMLGPTFAGLLFDINPDYAFLTFGALLIAAAVFTMINYRQLRARGVYTK